MTALESRTCGLHARQRVQGMIDLALFDAKVDVESIWNEYRKNRHRGGLLRGIEMFSSRQITRSK